MAKNSRPGLKRQYIDWDEPQYCKECNVRMRPAKAKVAKYPGTILHSSKGRCQQCVKGQTKTVKTEAELRAEKQRQERLERLNQELTIRGYARWQAQRNHRLELAGRRSELQVARPAT